MHISQLGGSVLRFPHPSTSLIPMCVCLTLIGNRLREKRYHPPLSRSIDIAMLCIRTYTEKGKNNAAAFPSVLVMQWRQLWNNGGRRREDMAPLPPSFSSPAAAFEGGKRKGEKTGSFCFPGWLGPIFSFPAMFPRQLLLYSRLHFRPCKSNHAHSTLFPPRSSFSFISLSFPLLSFLLSSLSVSCIFFCFRSSGKGEVRSSDESFFTPLRGPRKDCRRKMGSECRKVGGKRKRDKKEFVRREKRENCFLRPQARLDARMA